jgi:hypothetical protein
MKILALEQEVPGAAPDQFKPHLTEEAAKVWDLYQSGFVREIYFDRQRHTAVIILEAYAVSEVETVLAELPLVRAGLISFQLIELVPYSGFERLFSHPAGDRE